MIWSADSATIRNYYKCLGFRTVYKNPQRCVCVCVCVTQENQAPPGI